jgi:hypothetical protein
MRENEKKKQNEKNPFAPKKEVNSIARISNGQQFNSLSRGSSLQEPVTRDKSKNEKNTGHSRS